MKNARTSTKTTASTRGKTNKPAKSIRDLPVSKKSKDVRGGLISSIDIYDSTLYSEY